MAVAGLGVLWNGPNVSAGVDGGALQQRRLPLSKDVRLSRWLLVLIPVLTLALLGGTRLVIDSRTSKVRIAKGLANEIADRTGSSVRVEGMTFGLAYEPCVQGVEIFRASDKLKVSVATQEACVDRWSSALGSGFRAVKVHLDHPVIQLEGQRGDQSSKSLVEVRPEERETRTTTRAAAPKKSAALREFTLEFDDLGLDWKNLPVPERLANGTLGPLDGVVTVQKRGPESAATVSIREPRTGLWFAGRLTPTPTGWDLSLRVEGDLAPSFGPLLEGFDLDVRKLPVRGQVGAVYSTVDRTLTVDLDLVQQDVDVASRLVSARRLNGFQAREKLRLSIDLPGGRLSITDGLVEVNGIPAVVSLDVKGGKAAPEFNGSIALKTVPMARLLRSIPGTEPIEELVTAPNVLFALTFAVSGNLRDPETWKAELDQRVIGVGSDALGSGLEYLRAKAWDYHPLTKEGRSTQAFAMGPGSPRWVSYNQIPYVLRRAVQVSEDANFFVHHGLDIEEIQAAIVSGITKGERTRGGSTLTQQLIKNLYLSRDRTALRKIQEMLITFLMESSLTKEQIFEIYLNIIEWGPGLYGIKDAAQHYFGKSPGQLSPREAAYLALIIPGPMLYHAHYEQGVVPYKFQQKVEVLVDKLVKLGTLKPEQVPPAESDPIRFRRGKGAPVPAPAPGATGKTPPAPGTPAPGAPAPESPAPEAPAPSDPPPN